MAEPTYIGGMLFAKAHRLVRTRIYELLGQYDLTPSHWSLINIVMHAQDGIRAGTLAKRMSVKAPMVTILADELTDKDMIKKVAHHTDGRVRLLTITPKGKKLAQKVEKEMSQEIDRLLFGLTPTELQGFRRTLEVIIQNAS